jgi:RNA polymerase sigma-70 factor (sigma-E family)
MTSRHDGEFADYMTARLPALRRLAFLLCQDWHRADDIAQSAAITAYTHWARAARADNTDAYVNAILVREFLHERRSAWSRLVNLTDAPEAMARLADHDSSLDLQAAVVKLPPRQRAVLVLRFYSDLNVYQTAEALGCAPGTVKSQTAKALDSLRRAMGCAADAGLTGSHAAVTRAAIEGGQFHA